MSILDDILKEQGGGCSLAAAVYALEPDDRKEVVEALNDRENYQTAAIARALSKRGLKVNRQRVGYCRLDCSCGLLKSGAENG